MKLKFGNVLISIVLFDFLIEWLGQSFFTTIINLTPPNLLNYTNFTAIYNTTVAGLGNWGFFEIFAVISSYITAAVLTLAGFISYIALVLVYILSIFNLPFTFLPTIISAPLQILLIGLPMIILIVNLRTLFISFGGAD